MSKIYFFTNKTLRKFLLIIGISFFSTVLSTCSLSDIADDFAENLRNQDVNLIGVVVDGYIVHATVYLDCNKNFIRDVGEKPAFTDEKGQYKFKYDSEEKKEEEKKCPIVVDATDVDLVYDKDDVKDGKILSLREAGREGFKLSAPAGKHEVISPLTHIANTVKLKLTDEKDIDKLLKHIGITRKELEDAGISLTNFLYQDFVALAEGKTASHVWSKLAKKARVMTRMVESQQNKNGYTCFGKDCVENMKDVLGHFTNMYESISEMEKQGKKLHDFTAEEMKKQMKEMADKHHIGDEEFDLEDDYEVVSQENFLKSVMLRQTNEGDYCTADGKGSPDFRFLFAIFTASPVGKNTIVYAPTAEMYYDAYTLYKTSPDADEDIRKDLSCEDFFTSGKRERVKSLMALVDVANLASTVTNTSVRYEGHVVTTEGKEADYSTIDLEKTVIDMDCLQSDDLNNCDPFITVKNEDDNIKIHPSSDSYKLSVTGDFEAGFIPYMDSLEGELTRNSEEHHDDGGHM